MSAMAFQGYELVSTGHGVVARIRVRGNAVLTTPMINKGTAFTEDERQQLGLVGLLPCGVSTLEGQLRRIYGMYQRQPDDLEKNVFLANLRSRNEVLFYRLLSDHIDEMLPVVYTPTVGAAIQRYSAEYRRPRGVYLSIQHPEQIEGSFANYGLGADDVDLIVVTDSEGILGIGDWGVGGIEIAVGKLLLYIAAAGVHPRRVIPVVLDVGTDNMGLLNDPLYLGIRDPRVRGDRYDEFVDRFVTTVTEMFPHALLHWEDLGPANARRVLDRYAEQICTFNDDMQGTAAVVLAAVLSGVQLAGTPLAEQRLVIHGAGTAGIGIADLLRDVLVESGLSPEEAQSRFYVLASRGLLVDDQADRMRDFQLSYARPAGEVANWQRSGPNGGIALDEVVRRVRPTILIGTSTQAGAFTEPVVTAMAAAVERPIILPLSNPTSLAEAQPEDLIRWTGGRALIATGSPFRPVHHDGRSYRIAQANNALIFPGLGLGAIVVRARRITTAMLTAAARTLADLCDRTSSDTALLPPVDNLRPISAAVALAVADVAQQQGLARISFDDPTEQISQAMWRPEYPKIEAI
jgi:malate dehydrogenase (oxaloacetate-decarboxylating)